MQGRPVTSSSHTTHKTSKIREYLSGKARSIRLLRASDAMKTVYLALAFFFVIGSYTLIKELKDSVFVNIVGLGSMPTAKMLSMFVLIPLVFFYSKLVDILRRHHLLYFYALAYGIGGLICAYLLIHPTIGLYNTDVDKYRIFGWVFYFFCEGFSPFVVSVLWAFMNSVSTPEEVKSNYVTMTGCSKLGGAMGAFFAWWFLSAQARGAIAFDDPMSHALLLAIASVALIIVPFCIHAMMHKVNESSLHGYEAAYEDARKTAKSAETKKGGILNNIKSMLSGFILLMRYPYIMGIFGMYFFWEVINVIFNFMRLGVGQSETSSMSGFSAYLYHQAFLTHLVGVFVAFIGTRAVIRILGERRALMFVPIMTGIILACYLFVQTALAVTVTYIIIRAINYAVAYPLRESLYIPTTKDVKFKAKSWIDGVGTKLSKAMGSSYNLIIPLFPAMIQSQVNMVFFGIIIGFWTLLAHGLGRRFESAVSHNEVIGSE